MFVMTGYAVVEGFKPFKFNAVNVTAGVDNYVSKATIKVPGVATMKNADGRTYDKLDTAQQFKEGLKVEIWAGYNGQNKRRFSGFISRINYTVPVEIECEGWSYPLRMKKGITKSWPVGTEVRTILENLTAGTGIQLFEGNPQIKVLAPVIFRNVSGTQVLDWIKQNLLQTVYFRDNILYCGLRMGESIKVTQFRLGWNVIKDSELKFSPVKEFAEVNISLASRGKNGQYTRAKTSKRGDTKYMRLRTAIDQESIKRTAEEVRKELVNAGYEGSITAFAEPMVLAGEGVKIFDNRYPQRTGTYFVDEVTFDFGPGGGRQKIKIGQTLGTG